MSDEMLGKLIREWLTETGMGLYLTPMEEGCSRLTLMEVIPNPDDYMSVGDINLGGEKTVLGLARAGKGIRTPDMLLGKNHRSSLADKVYTITSSLEGYIGHFTNEHGDVSIFNYVKGQGRVWMSDNNWDEVPVVNGKPEGLVLTSTEMLWLAGCWIAATGEVPTYVEVR